MEVQSLSSVHPVAIVTGASFGNRVGVRPGVMCPGV